MSIRRIEVGPRMSQAVVHGNTVYLAGQVGEPGASVTDQTKAVLAEVDRSVGSCWFRQVQDPSGDHLACRHEGLR